MSKLRLDVDVLQVESFPVTEATGGRGTVRAMATAPDTGTECGDSVVATCNWTCDYSCTACQTRDCPTILQPYPSLLWTDCIDCRDATERPRV